MSVRSETLARALDLSAPLLTRYLAGFDDTNRTRQAPSLPNHAAWTMGHCAIAMLRLLNRVRGTNEFPEADFLVGEAFDPAHPGEASGRFSTASVVFGSSPIDKPSLYPRLERSIEVFDNARESLSTFVRGLDDHQLDTEIEWHAGHMACADLISRITIHNGAHAGQLTDLRRALGFAPVIT